MAIRARLGIRTAEEWHALPETDREQWLVWQMYVEHTLQTVQEQLADADTPEDERKNNLTPEAAVLLMLSRMGL